MRVMDSFPSKNCKMAIRTSVPMPETRSLRCCKPRVGKKSLSPHHQHEELASAPSLYTGGNPTHHQKHTHRASQVENGNHSPRAQPFSPLRFPSLPSHLPVANHARGQDPWSHEEVGWEGNEVTGVYLGQKGEHGLVLK